MLIVFIASLQSFNFDFCKVILRPFYIRHNIVTCDILTIIQHHRRAWTELRKLKVYLCATV